MNIGIVAVGHGVSRVIDNVKGFGKPSYAICVMLLSQQHAYGFAASEAFQQLPPQEHVLGTQLADLTVGCNQEVLFSVHAIQHLFQKEHTGH